MDEHQKTLILILRKLGIVEILITQADMDAVQALQEDDRPTLAIFQANDGVHVRVLTMAEAKEISESGPKIAQLN